MKKLLTLLMLTGCVTAMSQTRYRFDDYTYYKHNLFLQTPSALLGAAGFKAVAGDTAGAIQLIRDAASRGMYDTAFITGNSRTSFVMKTAGWTGIKKIIQQNRLAFSNASAMQVLTGDIDNFWRAFDQIDRPDADRIFMDEYIMKGTQGLRTFYEVRMGARITNLVDAVRKRKVYYKSIAPVTRQLHTFRPRIIDAAKNLKALYKDAIFPPTTFSLGMFGAFGTADGGAGQLIGVEFLCDTNHVDTSPLNTWERSVIADTSRITGIIIHELIHVQQHPSQDNSRLARCINEGAADLITKLVLGYHPNSKLHDYGDKHEKELWTKFSDGMLGENISDWLYNSTNTSGIPGDLGYYIGYKICEAYYNRSTNKQQAIAEILSVRDFGKFLQQSGYKAP